MFIPFYCYFCPKRISIPPLFKNLTQIYYEEKESASIFVGLLMCGCQMKEVINEYNVVPLPVTMSEQQGRFYLNSDVPIVVNASQEVKHIASGLSTTLLDIAGLKLKPTDELHENVPSIVLTAFRGWKRSLQVIGHPSTDKNYRIGA